MSVAEIERIQAEAIADEIGQESEPGSHPGHGPDNLPAQADTVAQEFAAFLTMAARIAATATGLHTIPERFNEAANFQIATAAVAICNRYGYDARKALLGGDSVVGLWLGLGVSIAIPGAGVWQDYKVMKAKEVKSEAASGDNKQPGE